MAFERNLIPLAHLFWIQVIDHGKSIKLVDAWSYISILNVRQTAQVNNEIGAPTLARQFIAGTLHVSICQTETFAGPAQPGAGLHVWSGKFSRVTQTPNRHGEATFLLCFQNNGSGWSGSSYPISNSYFFVACDLAQSKSERQEPNYQGSEPRQWAPCLTDADSDFGLGCSYSI